VRRIIELNHGTVGVGPTPGGGATFQFTLPLGTPVPTGRPEHRSCEPAPAP